jgi:hypothetical protein
MRLPDGAFGKIGRFEEPTIGEAAFGDQPPKRRAVGEFHKSNDSNVRWLIEARSAPHRRVRERQARAPVFSTARWASRDVCGVVNGAQAPASVCGASPFP